MSEDETVEERINPFTGKMQKFVKRTVIVKE